MERLLGISTNNDPVPDAVNWEIKTSSRSNLLTLFHLSPSGGSLHSVVRNFGWIHRNPERYKLGTLSFRWTVSTITDSRGFCILMPDGRLSLAFDPESVASQYGDWLQNVRKNCGGVLTEPPSWTMDAIEISAGAKLRNLMLVHAKVREKRYVSFTGADLYRDLRLSAFRKGLRDGWIKVDFDARTSGRGLRDHGTKFRIIKSKLPDIYTSCEKISLR